MWLSTYPIKYVAPRYMYSTNLQQATTSHQPPATSHQSQTRRLAAIVEIVQMCGLDPKTATVEDMDKVDVRFQCKCSHHRQQRGYMPIMNWRTAVRCLLHTHTHRWL